MRRPITVRKHTRRTAGNKVTNVKKHKRTMISDREIKEAVDYYANIKTKDEARQKAIEWQQMASETSMSYGELIEWQSIFEAIAKKFGLTKEFKENGII